jgi:hypothetical protein
MKQARDRAHRIPLLASTALLGLVGLSIQRSAQADPGYWRVSTDRLTVISDTSGRRCTKVAAQFLAFERVLRDVAGLDEDGRFLPLTVYVLSDWDSRRVFLTDADKHQEAVRNMRIYSKYLPGRDFNVAAVVDTGSIEEPLQSVLLLYAQSLLTSGSMRALPWYVIGVYNIFNGVLIRDDGSMLLSRDGPFEPDMEKSAHLKYDLATLLATTPGDLTNGGDWKAFSKRARDWAQYGLLTTPERRAHYRELAALMRQGTPVEQAVNDAFGAPLAVVSKDLDDAKWRREADFRIPATKSTIELPSPEHLEVAQSDTLLQVVADRVAQQPLHP